MTAEVGPVFYDLNAKFLSQRTVLDAEAFLSIAFLASECITDCQNQADMGENGYAAGGAKSGSVGNKSDVWFTGDHGESWQPCNTSHPFAAAMSPSKILVVGTKKNHRVLVANGTTRPANHAQIAYADVTVLGTTNWINVDLPSANGSYITDMVMLDWGHLFACTNDGYIYMSNDGGATWVAVYGSGIVDFNKMAGLVDGTVWAVGNSDLIVLSQDYGETWTAITGPVGITADAKAVAVTPDGTVFVGYGTGVMYGSYDLGDTWTALSLQGITPTNVVDIQNFGDSCIWVIADIAGSTSKVLRSIDGGATFRLWNLALPTNAGLHQLFVIDPNIVFVVGEPQGTTGFITRTTSNLIGM
jgi:hypothetical protein